MREKTWSWSHQDLQIKKKKRLADGSVKGHKRKRGFKMSRGSGLRNWVIVEMRRMEGGTDFEHI